jgi:hypothetical protein
MKGGINMRHWKLAVILSAGALLFLAPPAAVRASDNSTFTASGVDTLTITGYAGPGGAVVIPSILEGRPVVGIGAGAFLNRSGLTSVTIPASVTLIGPFAFSGCSGLRYTFFYGHAPVMGPSVFAGCASDFTVYADSVKAGFTYPKWDGYRAAACTDADRDGYYSQGGACGAVDCNDNDSSVNPGAAEACNTIDDDCDGMPDNGLPFAYYYRDDDGDGYGDPDIAGRVLACEQPEGYADNSTGFDCNDNDSAVHPRAPDDNCNGVDEDCDNATDEGYEGVATGCGIGACARTGRTSCPAGAVETVDSCLAGEPAASDASCNGIDDDCDGTADEDYVPGQTSCGVGACASQGFTLCVNGVVLNTCRARRPASDANCNGIDDDCDGTADEDYASEQTSCGAGICAGNTGSTACAAGSVADSCDPLAGARADTTCNGIDEDCDGVADDDYIASPTTCGTGACMSEGLTRCVNGLVQDTCSARSPSSDANCNGIDEDCDGAADDDYAARTTTCGVGACAAKGAARCVSGLAQDNCTAGNPAQETCNGTDDDCDGAIDNGLEFITYYRDSDADTYGNKYTSVAACNGPPEGYVDSLTDNKTAMAFDCDDSDASLHAGCPASACGLKVAPRRIFKLLAFFDPLIPFVVSLERDSDMAFAPPIAIDWGTEAINDIIRSKIGPRSVVGFLLVRSFQLETGEFDVTVTFGADSGSCAGTIAVE